MPRSFAWMSGGANLLAGRLTEPCRCLTGRPPVGALLAGALLLLGVPPADALFVGDDHRWDIVGAQNAGLRPVLLDSAVPKPRRDHLPIPNLSGSRACSRLISAD